MFIYTYKMIKSLFLFSLITLFAACNGVKTNDKNLTALEKLELGNERFMEGRFQNHRSPQLLEDLSKGQHPFAVVVSCSDSRISPNVLFDTDLGDLFIIRTAGNILGEVDLASIEFAVEHLNTKLIVVLGHSQCGAIKAFLNQEKPRGHIKTLLDSLKAEPEEQALIKMHDHNADHYVRSNIVHQVNYIRKNSEIIRERIDNKTLEIKEAYLDTKSGKITFN